MNKEELMPFCSESIFGITEPWSEGDYSYATNGHILIRIPKLDDVLECESAPRQASGMFPTIPEAESCRHSLSAISITDGDLYEVCEACKGTGNLAKCPECGGLGIVEVSNAYSDYEVDCASCDGTGKAPICKVCDGTGKIEKLEGEMIGEAWFQKKYLRLLKALPDCEIGDQCPAPLSPAYYRFSGGDGLLMPMRPPLGEGGRVT